MLSLLVLVAPSGEVFKDIHNTDLVYLKFKYAYAEAEDGEYNPCNLSCY